MGIVPGNARHSCGDQLPTGDERTRRSHFFENFYDPWQRWFDLRVYPSRDGGFSIYFQDATDRKKAEEALRRLNETLERQVIDRTAELQEKQARLRTIFETSYAYQGLIALDGTLLDANSTSLSGIGAGLGDVVGLPFGKPRGSPARPAWQRWFARAFPLSRAAKSCGRKFM